MRKSGFFRGFGYAWSGLVTAVREERNLRFHLVAGAFVLYFSRFYDFTRGERLLLVALICGVVALELVNSSIERAVARARAGQVLYRRGGQGYGGGRGAGLQHRGSRVRRRALF